MAQEENTQRCSNSSSGGGNNNTNNNNNSNNSNRSLNKVKQKKVPQRGLGVAQLEKIRLEEQQKKDAANVISPPNSVISPTNSSSCLAVQCSNFRPNFSPPLPPPSSTDLPLPNPVFRPPSSISSIDGLKTNLGPGQGNWPKLWNGELNLEGENQNQKLDYNGLSFWSNMSLPCESNNPIWPLPNIMERSQQFQQPFSSSMVNVSTGTSSSSVTNFQMEPPSNQSYCGNNYTHFWPEDEKTVGMKRSYPFSIENAPGPSFNYKFPPIYVSPISRSDESASCSNGSTINIEHANPIFREKPSSSSGKFEPNPKKVMRENGSLNGDFLTLAPPATTQQNLSLKQKHPSSYLSGELPGFESLPYQVKGCGEDRIQQPFYSFLPSANTGIRQVTTTISNNNGGVGESVDLNLKL